MRAARALTMREKREYNAVETFVPASILMWYTSEKKSTDGRLAVWTKQLGEKSSACCLTRLYARRRRALFGWQRGNWLGDTTIAGSAEIKRNFP
jgi:hypothetical protein